MFLTGQLLGSLQVDRPNPFLPCLSIWMTRKQLHWRLCDLHGNLSREDLAAEARGSACPCAHLNF